MTYFKERGFTEETIQKFRLGFSPDEWTAFTDNALAKGYQLEFLEKQGSPSSMVTVSSTASKGA